MARRKPCTSKRQAEQRDRWRSAAKARYELRMQQAREMLGGKCEKCGHGHTEERILQFDHIDPLTKNFDIPSGWSKSHDKFFDEVELCQLLCSECHTDKTNEERRRGVLAMARERSKKRAAYEAEHGETPF